MKALLYVGAGGAVCEWYAEDGEYCPSGKDTYFAEIRSVTCHLSQWFHYGWKIHGGFSTALNGLTCVILRDGKAFWVDKETPHA